MSATDHVRDYSDAEVAARLLDLGMKGASAGGDRVYSALLSRYASSPQVSKILHDLASARDLTVHDVDLVHGLTVTARPESEWAYTPSRISAWNTSDHVARAALLVLFSYIPALFYPSSREVDDPAYTPDPKSVDDIVRGLAKACEVARSRAEDGLDDESTPERVWQSVLSMPERASVDSQKVKKIHTLHDAAQVAVRILKEKGFIKQHDEDRYFPTRAYQSAIRHSGVPAFYSFAASLAQEDN